MYKEIWGVFETWLHVGIWIDATGINWSSWLWVTTSTLSTKGQGRSHWLWNLHYIQPFNSHWPKNFSWIAACVCETQNNTNTWHKFHSFWYCHYTWKVTVSVALHISQSLHLCIVCIEGNIEFLWFIATARCWLMKALIIVDEEILCL